MDADFLILLAALGVIAFLYSSVGHGGASGYLAVMALAGIEPSLMKSSALIMNLAVSFISFAGFYRAGYFRFRLFYPFALTSIPLAYVGGTMVLPDSIYKKVLAVCLIIAVGRLIFRFEKNENACRHAPLWACLLAGGIIGLVSGMIGIGGGIILSPLILFMCWGTMKETASVSALFIFVNSISGLAGQIQKGTLHLTEQIQFAIIVTVIGGSLGSWLGSSRFNFQTLKYFLAVGLTIAVLKLMFV